MAPFQCQHKVAPRPESCATVLGRPQSEYESVERGCTSTSPPSDEFGQHGQIGETERRWVIRSSQQLRLHPALDGQSIDVLEELNEAARLQKQQAYEPILITRGGMILAGFGQWKLALLEGKNEITCIEYPLGEYDAVQFMLAHHRTRRGWNAFTRIRLALALETILQEQAVANMQAGGKYKGLAKLPEAQHIDVRKDIGRIVGVCARNVGKVKAILQTAHPRLLEALRDGILSINHAANLCRLPKGKQVEQFTQYTSESAINGVINGTMSKLGQTAISLDALTVLGALQQHEAGHPGSVTVRASRRQRTIVLIGQDRVRLTLSARTQK